MDRVMIDASVWGDFLNGNPGNHVEKAKASFVQAELCICQPIIQEVLQGIRSEHDYQRTKQYLLDLEILSSDSVNAAVESAELYRFIRKKGIRLVKSNSCLIAWFAIMFGVKLLHNDHDFDMIKRFTSLQVY